MWSYHLLWRTKCGACGRQVRLVAAYVGPLALDELLKEAKDVQQGIISPDEATATYIANQERIYK